MSYRRGICKVKMSLIWLTILLMPQLFTSCKVSYSFSGVNISPEITSVSVDYFQNRAPVVQAQLSQLFTDALIDKIQANTSLELIP